MLDIEAPALKHLRILQEKRACQRHPEGGVVVGPSLDRPLAQGLPTAMLIAFLVVAKVQDHLPLERLSGMFQRWGTRVAPSTLGGWYQAAATLLAPIAERLGETIHTSPSCMHTDASNIRVIDPDAPHGSTRGSLWGYTVKELGAYFEYTPDGSFQGTRAVLSARGGPTMTDGHKAYASQRLPGSKKATRVVSGVHLNCFDHARRPFEEAFRLDGDVRACTILRRIQRIYRVEDEARRAGLDADQTKALRDRKSRPLLNQLFADLEHVKATVTPKSRLGGAAKTILRRRPLLEAYLQNGSWPMSNALQETQFRSKAIGQHNWLFLGSHDSGQHYATLLTLVRSCMMLDIDPVAYLADVVVRVQKRGSSKAVDGLLPSAWKSAQGAAAVARQDRVA
jgi:transposase